MKTGGEFYLLDFFNTMHQVLKTTVEVEDSLRGISFLDLNLSRIRGKV